MLCLKCENEKFSIKKVKIEQEFKGRTLKVIVEAMACDTCDFNQFTDDQANMLRRETVELYKREEKLLTAEQIRKYREDLGMSQVEFATYLGVGVASIKRWETCFVQEKSQDELIRIKCDPAFAQNTALEVGWAHEHPDIYNGYRKFDLKICQNVMAKIIEVAASPLFFFKAIFYIDFLHFKKYGNGITGMQYSCLQYGPIPKDYDHLIRYLLDKGIFEKNGKHDLVSKIEFDKKLFSTDELETINHIYDIIKKEGRDYLLDKSHEEEAFKACAYLEKLNYEDAKTLKLS